MSVRHLQQTSFLKSARYDVLKQYFFLENLAYSRILQSFLQKLEVRRNLNIDTLQEVRWCSTGWIRSRRNSVEKSAHCMILVCILHAAPRKERPQVVRLFLSPVNCFVQFQFQVSLPFTSLLGYATPARGHLPTSALSALDRRTSTLTPASLDMQLKSGQAYRLPTVIYLMTYSSFAKERDLEKKKTDNLKRKQFIEDIEA
jgi:hypothetical protein